MTSKLDDKRDNKNSRYRDASNDYLLNNKKVKLETNNFEFITYFNELNSICSDFKNDHSNCIKKHFKSDEKFAAFVMSYCNQFNKWDYSFFNSYRFGIFKSLPSKSGSSNGHTQQYEVMDSMDDSKIK